MIAPTTNRAIDGFLDRMNQLHSAPQVAQKILLLTRAADFDVRKVAQCIESDPALSAKILRVANSSRYGLRHKVTSVRQAVTFIGQRSLRLIALTFGLVESLTRGARGKQYADFWRRSLTIATVAAELAKTKRELNADEAYSAGLLADMGELVFAQLEPERFFKLVEHYPHGAELLVAERAEFGFAHPELGARLLQRWELPEELIEAVALHHVEDEETALLTVAVHAGDLMAHALWTPRSKQVAESQALLEKEFGIDLDAYIAMAVTCQHEIDENAKMFGISLEGSIDCETLLEEARRAHDEASLEAALDLDSITAAIEDTSP
jgi:HD-like signal output (HDOD) protein